MNLLLQKKTTNMISISYVKYELSLDHAAGP